MMSFRHACWILKELGPRWVAFRIRYALSRKLGLLERRCPLAEWGNAPEGAWKVGATLGGVGFRGLDEGGKGGDEAEAILQGRFRFFSCHDLEAGMPPDWFRDPFHDQRYPSEGHWSRLDDFSRGDIKLVWELSRWDWVFPLVRAHARTGRRAYLDAFVQLFRDWMLHNPPNRGGNWKCGQEAALRLRALWFAERGFGGALDGVPDLRGDLDAFVWHSARRIEANLSYALSQNSNHGHSELTGLWLAGLRFRETPEGRRWLALARRHLEPAVENLNFPDGGCCMYSMVYHRMMLDVLTVLWVSAREAGERLPPVVEERMKQAADFLYEFIDVGDGRVPLFGSNDGARILPLSETGFEDFRPLLQRLFWITGDSRSFGSGPWNESLVWLGATEEERARHETASLPVQRRVFAAEGSGFCNVRAGDMQVAIRVGEQKFRPGQLNHLALWLKWRGRDILVEPGSYSYNAPPPFEHAFKETRSHNTAFVEGASQMRPVGRFLALPWLGSELCSVEARSVRMKFSGFPEVSGGMEHCRHLRWTENELTVEDSLASKTGHIVGIHWLLPQPEESGEEGAHFWFRYGDMKVEIEVETPEGGQVHHYCEPKEGRWGTRSRVYQQLEPALSLVARSPSGPCCRFKTIIRMREV